MRRHRRREDVLATLKRRGYVQAGDCGCVGWAENSGALQDTWKYDPAASPNWVDVTSTGGTPPPGRDQLGMVVSSFKLFFFGGTDGRASPPDLMVDV
eukprot:1668313-Rhodomonas_salina.1